MLNKNILKLMAALMLVGSLSACSGKDIGDSIGEAAGEIVCFVLNGDNCAN